MAWFDLDRLLDGWLAPRPERRPPNIVWICADDFTTDACAAYGNTAVWTPNLDRLARQGLRFDRAFCNCPLSTPSRQAFWTGRYPRSIGVTLTPTPLPDGEVTLPAMLRRAGYETAAFGKTHYYHPRPDDFDVCYDLPDYEAWLQFTCRAEIPPRLKVLGPWRPFADPPSVWLNAGCWPYPATDDEMSGTYFARHAAQYLGRPRDKPFFLYVSFYETHSPFRFPISYRGKYDPRSIRAPEPAREDIPFIPEVFRELTYRDRQGIIAAYYTCAEFLDKNVGLVLAALDRSPHAADTLVLFTSDHGYLLGQHGRFEKHCCYDPAIRAPLIVRWPGVVEPGRATGAVVELLDLTPTLLESAGVTAPGNIQGKSLLPLLRGAAEAHRDCAVVEYADNEEIAVRTPRWKFIYGTGKRRRRDGYALPGGPGVPTLQLFDLEEDPEEVHNLAGERRHRDRVHGYLGYLADHAARTARDPAGVPDSPDPRTVLDGCLAPCDNTASLQARARSPRP